MSEKLRQLLEAITSDSVTRVFCPHGCFWEDYMQGPTLIAKKLAQPCDCGLMPDAVDVTAEYEEEDDDAR